jgi:quaternary ammonium compound-resistance protein SugE
MFRWLMLLIAGLCEIVWAEGLRFSDGLTKLKPTVIMVIFGALSCYCLALATRSIPLGVAYAIWGGIGEIGILTVGYFLYGEIVSPAQLFFISLIITSIIGIKISS